MTGTGGRAAGGSGAGGVGAGGTLATGGSGAGGVGAGGTVATGGTSGGYPENTGADCAVSSASMLSKKNTKLPDPFAMHDGTRISTKAAWERRRNEIKKDIEKYN